MLVEFDAILDKLKRVELWLSVSVISGIILLNTINLLLRWFAGISLAWVLEISLNLFVWGVMLCIPAVYKDKGLIQMRLLEEIVSKNAMRYINLIVEIIILMFLTYLIPHSIELCSGQIHLLSRGLGIPRIYVTLPMPVAAFLILFVNINSIIHQIKDIRGGGK